MAGGGAQQGQPDNSMGILWIIAAIFIFVAAIWYVFKRQIVSFYLQIKLQEIWLISHFTHRLDDVRTAILTTDPLKFSFDDVTRIGSLVGDYLRIPFVLIIVVLAFIIYFSNATRVFKRAYDMHALADAEKVNWPQITPVLKLNLVKQDIDKGPWAMAMTPMQFCKRYKLLEEYKVPVREGGLSRERNRIEVNLKRGQANKIFSMQVGPLWPGLEKLPPHSRALFAVFAARYAGDTKAAAELLAHISASSIGKMNFTGTEALLKKHANTKNIQRIMQSHGYVLTVMASMLEAAREDGVQASADFLWLKPIDRRMWYMLNTVGRQTPFVEVAGPFAHWKAEKQIGRRLLVPMVEEATNALELVLKEILYRPDEVD
jgi:intracellular multiplication protein IcmP